jgi:plastocyanin
MRRITWLLALVLAAGVLTAAGCGGDDDNGGSGSSSGGTGTESDSSSSSGGGGETLTVTADPGGQLSWDKSELSAKAGKVTLKIVNESSIPHAIEVEGNGVEEKTETITGGEGEVTADLEAGEYEFYCPVGNHKDAGMEGTLTVG